MSGSSQPCAMCGTEDFARTKEHVLPRAWKKDFPWINSGRTRSWHRSAQDEMHRDVPLQYLEQSVGPFCGHCNHVFMLKFDAAALPIFKRLARTTKASVLADEIEPLRAWAYKTMLVRTLLDAKAGLQAPTEWFRDFRRSDGAVPATTVQFIAFLDHRTAALGNTVVGMTSATGEPLRVHETSVVFDGLAIFTLAMDPSPSDAVNAYRAYVSEYFDIFRSVLVPLQGERELSPFALLPVRLVDALRSPTAVIQGPDPLGPMPFPTSTSAAFRRP